MLRWEVPRCIARIAGFKASPSPPRSSWRARRRFAPRPPRCPPPPTRRWAGASSGRSAPAGPRRSAGVPRRSDTSYLGGADGGVWKSDDAGAHLEPAVRPRGLRFDRGARDGAERSRGALGRHRPDHQRWDIAAGDGVYRSDRRRGRRGATWALQGTRHIGRIWVHPREARRRPGGGARTHLRTKRRARRVPHRGRRPDLDQACCSVNAGHRRRGPGGGPVAPGRRCTRRRGRCALSLARLFRSRRSGPGSGIYKSNDGGRTWTAGRDDGPAQRPLGRIELAVAPGSERSPGLGGDRHA